MAISDDLNSIRTHLEDDYEALEQLGVSVEDRNIKNIKDMANQIYAKFPKTEYQEGTEVNLGVTTKGKLDYDNGVVGIGQTEQKILPDEYQEVEYIGSSGTQYINTGKYISNDNIHILTKIETPNMPNAEQDIIGNQDGSTGRFIVGLSAYVVFAYSRNGNYIDPNAASVAYSGKQTFDIDMEFNYSTLTKTLKVNNRAYDKSYTCSIIGTNNPVQILANGVEANLFVGKIYYLKLYQGDSLSLDLIPCYRISDNEIGLYDLVSNTFLTNSGTGTFTKGENAPTPNAKIPINSVTGNQDVVVSGKNEFNGSIYNGQVGSNGGYSSSTTRITNISGEGVIGTTLLSKGTHTISIANLDYCSLLTKNSSGTILDNFANEWHSLPYTFTLTQEGYISFTARKSDNSNINPSDYNVMLEKGTTTGTNYEPYITPTTHQLSLGDIELNAIGNYKDELIYDVDEDKVYKNEKIEKDIFNGSENWQSYQFGTNSFYISMAKTTDSASDTINILSNFFRGCSADDRVTAGDNIIYSSSVDIIIRNTTFNTLQEFKTFLSTRNMEIYRKLKDPTLTEITDTTLKTQVKALYNAHSNNGTTIITSNGDLPMIIKVRGLKGE